MMALNNWLLAVLEIWVLVLAALGHVMHIAATLGTCISPLSLLMCLDFKLLETFCLYSTGYSGTSISVNVSRCQGNYKYNSTHYTSSLPHLVCANCSQQGNCTAPGCKSRALTYSNGMLLQRKIENGFCKHMATGKSLWGRWQALQDKRNVVIPVTPHWNQTRSFGGYHLGKKTTTQELSLTCILGSTGSPPPFLSSLRICSPVASSQTYNSLLLPRSALPPSIPTSGSPARARACWAQLPTGCHQRS